MIRILGLEIRLIKYWELFWNMISSENKRLKRRDFRFIIRSGLILFVRLRLEKIGKRVMMSQKDFIGLIFRIWKIICGITKMSINLNLGVAYFMNIFFFFEIKILLDTLIVNFYYKVIQE